MRKRTRRQRGGFTLMELMLVLLILVVLASVVSVSVVTIRRNANNRVARAQVGMLEEALQYYQSDVGALPADFTALYNPPAELQNSKKWQGPYLDKQIANDPWGNPYTFEISQDEFSLQRPTIKSSGPDRQPGTGDDISNRDTSD